MLRFTLRDMLWLMALIGAGLMWWAERRKTISVTQDANEAVVLWQDANEKWAAVKGPPNPFHAPMDGGGGTVPGAERQEF